MANYFMQRLDPRWQRRRLEIMERDNFTCTSCGRSNITLNVHHKQYISGHDYWDYQDSDLTTLCQECHKKQHNKPPNDKIIHDSKLASERKILMDKLTNKNYKEIFPRLIEIDKAQHFGGVV